MMRRADGRAPVAASPKVVYMLEGYVRLKVMYSGSVSMLEGYV